MLWINELYYNTFKGNTFDVPVNVGNEIWAGDAIDYATVTNINLNSQSLTTDFTDVMLSKFTSLTNLLCYSNNIAILDVTNLVNLTKLYCYNNQISTLDISNNTLLEDFWCFSNQLTSLNVSKNLLLTRFLCLLNQITTLDISNNTLLNILRCENNLLTTLDISNNALLIQLMTQSNQLNAAANSQILIDLDSHGLSNGYFQGSIFGGGSLTAAGTTAKNNLLTKGWTIVGL